MNCLGESIQWVNCVVFITTFLTLHTPYGQWSVFDHNGYKQSMVPGTRYGIWWPLYGQFEVGWLQPLHLWLGAGISSVAPVLVSREWDLCHVQLHPTWFEPTSECRSWPVASYLYSGHLPVGLYLGRETLLLAGPLFHFPQCHSGSVSSRNERVCLYHSVTRAGSWYGKWKGSLCLHPQLPANRTLSQSR